ncbi:MAG: hypothetical protein PQJ28_02105, partial [Spirochaetales bacterium]|nr:hypothetical protein [Spirochaetales bacterium]
MDVETLTNHISKLGKKYFSKACSLVLNDIFGYQAIDIDGAYDGGADFISFKDGEREPVAFQITTQKTDLKGKGYRDADKAIRKLGIQRFYYITSYNLDEIKARLLESEIAKELKVAATCLSPSTIAGLIIRDGKVNKFLETVDAPLPRNHGNFVDIKEKALHSYSIFSEDSDKLKLSVYEDTILFSLYGKKLTEDELINSTITFLNLSEDKHDF